MQIGLVGLGRMGMNMGRRWLKGGHEVVAYNRTFAKTEELARDGAKSAKTLAEFVQALRTPRIVWLMLPAGAATDEHLNELADLLSPGDLLVDGGNNYYKEDIRHADVLKKKLIHFAYAGDSGGIGGPTSGSCTMSRGRQPCVRL